MNKIIFALAICLISTLYSNAQWYQRSCGVTDINNTTSEEFECLWKKANKNVIGGAITTGIGSSIVVIGLIAIAHASLWDMDDELLITGIGFIIGFIGIPTLITGIVRKSTLRKTPTYDILNLESLNFSPVIGLNQFNGTNYLGISLSLSF